MRGAQPAPRHGSPATAALSTLRPAEVIAPAGMAGLLAKLKCKASAPAACPFPPAAYVHMPADGGMAPKVAENLAALRAMKLPAAEIKVGPRSGAGRVPSRCRAAARRLSRQAAACTSREAGCRSADRCTAAALALHGTHAARHFRIS